MLCEYGCGQEGRYLTTNGKNCCSKHQNSCPAVRERNSNGLRKSYSDGCRKSGSSRYNDLCEEAKLNMKWRVGKYDITHDQLFIENSNYSSGYAKKRIIDEKLIPYKCECGNEGEWLGKKLVLELEHKNGVSNDHRLSNLTFLCPNCHSQTVTFRGRNGNSGQRKYTDEQLIEAVKISDNIHQVCKKLFIAPKGANFETVRKRMTKLNLVF